MVEGYYAIGFRGAADWGIGMLILHGGWITGADVGGVYYDGTYADRGDEIEISVRMRIPPGISLVQGAPGEAAWRSVEFRSLVPKRALSTSEPILLNLPMGPVNVTFRRVREISRQQ